MTAPGRQRNVFFTDSLYGAVVKAAAREQARTGEHTSAAEWIRTASIEKLRREERDLISEIEGEEAV